MFSGFSLTVKYLIPMKISDLLRHIDTFAPFSLAEEWDNSGLLIGSPNNDITKIAVCLDAVTNAVIEADNLGCNVLVTHHPLIFRPVKKITDTDEQGRTIFEAVRRNVSIIAAHTNWDKAFGGVNDILAALLGMSSVENLDEFDVTGTLNERMTLPKFAQHVKTSWGLSNIDIFTLNEDAEIQTVSLCGGSGAEFWRSAKLRGSDVYVTADMKYHEISDAVNEGMTIALVNHGEMERASIPQLAEKIKACGIETVIIDVKALPSILRI